MVPCINAVYPVLLSSSLHTAAAPTVVRAAVQTVLNDTIKLFSSKLTKLKTMLKLFWPLLLRSKILGLIYNVQNLSIVSNNTTVILPSDDCQ